MARENRVLAEQISQIYQQIPMGVIGANVGAWITAFVLWEPIANTVLVFWLLLVFATYGLMLGLYLLYRRENPSPEHASKWANRYIALGWLSAGAWGSAGILLFAPDSLQYQFFLCVAVTAGVAAMLPATASYRPAFYLVIALLAPLSFRFLIEADPIPVTIGFGIGFLLVYSLYLHGNINRAIVKSLNLQFENLALAEQLTAQKEEAEEANLAKSHFLAAASHDLRQPLHAQGLFVGELIERIHDPAACREIINKLESSMAAMRSLFDALLDLSRLEAGVVQPEITDFPVRRLLSALQQDYTPQAEAKGLELRVRESGAVIRTDPALMGRIVRNFVENAIRYTESGGVLIGCRRSGSRLRITVWDTGMGISSEQQRSIFREFHQLGNVERDRSKGLGLGLAVAEHVSKLLDHPIRVASVPGRGSSFSVEVPLAGCVTDAGNHSAIPAEVPIDLEGTNVLIIDDDATVLESMEGLLKSWGCKVLSASTAGEALAEIARQATQPDVVLVDFRLRDGADGVLVMDKIKAVCGDSIPGILVTGDTLPSRLRSAHASNYPLLHKPVHPARLRTLLRHVLGKRAG